MGFREMVEELKNKKKIRNQRWEEIEERRKEFEKSLKAQRDSFEESLEPLKKELVTVSEELNSRNLGNISIRIGDLVKEISLLTGVKLSDIGVEIITTVDLGGEYSLQEIASHLEKEKQRNHDYGLYVRIFSDTNIPGSLSGYDNRKFNFVIYRTLDLNELQNDGKILLEHCEIIKHDASDLIPGMGGYATRLVVNKNIFDLNVILNLVDLIRDDDRNYIQAWYPANTFTQAIINYVERKNSKKQWNASLWHPLCIKPVKVDDVVVPSKSTGGFVPYQAPNDRYEVRGIMPPANPTQLTSEEETYQETGPKLVKRKNNSKKKQN